MKFLVFTLNRTLAIYLSLILGVSMLTGCGQECYSTATQVKAKYERCADLGTNYASIINKEVWTFACSTSGNDMYADFIIKDGKYCRTYQIEARTPNY